MKNWETQFNKWKKFNKQEIHYHKEIHKIKNETKKIEKNDETVIYFNNFNKNLSVKMLNTLNMISNVWAVDSDWYLNSESFFHSTYNQSIFMNFLSLFESETSEDVKDNLIIYIKIKMIKLQIDDQILTVQNICYNNNLAHNLISYRSLKW